MNTVVILAVTLTVAVILTILVVIITTLQVLCVISVIVIVRGWRNTVGNLIELFWLKQTYHGPQFTCICVKNRWVRFHRIRDFKQYYFNSIPPTSHIDTIPPPRSPATPPDAADI